MAEMAHTTAAPATSQPAVSTARSGRRPRSSATSRIVAALRGKGLKTTVETEDNPGGKKRDTVASLKAVDYPAEVNAGWLELWYQPKLDAGTLTDGCADGSDPATDSCSQ